MIKQQGATQHVLIITSAMLSRIWDVMRRAARAPCKLERPSVLVRRPSAKSSSEVEPPPSPCPPAPAVLDSCGINIKDYEG